MPARRGPVVRLVALAAVALAAAPSAAQPVPYRPYKFEKGDHVVLLGNSLADRMQHDGWLEAYIQARHPNAELSIRNLGFPGDEVGGYLDKPDANRRQRSANFGSGDEWLKRTQADVILAFFGYNESFAGPAGVGAFKADLENMLAHFKKQKYNDKSAPRVVLFSPIAFEDHKSPNLPHGEDINKNLEIYTAAMKEVAAKTGTPFVDLYHPTQQLYAAVKSPMTLNGVHLSPDGNKALAGVIDQLFLFGPMAGGNPPDMKAVERLRTTILDKNWHWYNRYRATDGYSVYGGRADLKFVGGQTNRVVAQRELEILDVMTANRDKVIWLLASKGEARTPDDSNTPDFIPVQTNKPGAGPNGEHLFLSGEAAISKMTVAKGLKVNLFADEAMFPEIANPVQMAFDPAGRLWVACWPTYPHWTPKGPHNDKLVVLEDTDGDGKADKLTVFADDLHNPTGFEFYNGGVLVAQAPDLLFLKDTDGDGKADLRTRLVGGLDTADTHHTSNSFVLDPGGSVYFQEGTFHHSQVESPYGPPRRVANGAVFKYEPRTQKFDIYVTTGFANPHGHVFDRWGQDIVVDGTGANPYHATLFSGYLPFPNKHPKPPQVYQQRTRPCGGMEYLSSQHFPPEFDGNLAVTNCIGFQGVLRYKIEDADSSFKGRELEPILSSTDINFRPVDCKTGPDGALYVIDWQNPIIGHMQHNLRDPSRDKTHGRIYRVTAEGRPLSVSPKLAGQPVPALLDVLKHPEDRVRSRARTELTARDAGQVMTALDEWVKALDPKDAAYEHHLLEAAWLRQSFNVVDVNGLTRVLRSPDFRTRAAAVRILVAQRDRIPEALDFLRTAINDAHPRVRLEAVRGASFFPAADALPVLIEALAYPDDQYIKFTFKESLRTIEGQLGVSGGAGGVAATLVKMLASGKVPADRQAGYIDAICRQGGPAELKAVFDTVVNVEALPGELRKTAADGLADAASTRKVKPAGKLEVGALLAAKDPTLRLAGVKLAGAWQAADAASAVRKLATDPAEPVEVQAAAAEALGAFADADSKTTLATLAGAGSPPRVRYPAVAALARTDADKAATLAAAALAGATPADDIGIVIDAFLTRKGGAEKLAAAITATKVPADPAKLALRYMYGAGRSDATLSAALTKAAGLTADPKPPTAGEVQGLMAEVMAKGDAARGEAVFRRADLGCFKCHAVSKGGGQVGPELSAVGGASPLDYVIVSVLDPSAAIKELYTTRVVSTVNDQVFTGILVQRDKERLVLKDATGKLITVATADIDAEKEGKSLMPEGLTKFLTRQELLDLCRFLSELGKPGPYGIQTAPTVQRWRVLRSPDFVGKPNEDRFAKEVAAAKPDAWERMYATVDGRLPWAELKGKGDVVYVQAEIDVAIAGPVQFNLAGVNGGTWIDGKAVAKDWKGGVNLPGGRHAVTFRVDLAGDATGKAVRVEVVKPIGASGQFEIVNGS